jgi:hypothetical protein
LSDFPTIFDWLAWAEPIRGFPAAYLVIAAAAVVVAVWDWRIALLALAAQYLLAGLLFVDVLDPRVAYVKILVGLFVCLMLYITARQVEWGKTPPDLTAEEAARLYPVRYLQWRRFRLSLRSVLRLGLVALVTILVLEIGQRANMRLPVVPEPVNLAIYGLLALGLLGMGVSGEPLKAGMGLLIFMSGFELLYSSLEQSLAMLTLLAVANLIIALAIAYLTQAHHVLPWQLDDH